jgi:hypothetical protein
VYGHTKASQNVPHSVLIGHYVADPLGPVRPEDTCPKNLPTDPPRLAPTERFRDRLLGRILLGGSIAAVPPLGIAR